MATAQGTYATLADVKLRIQDTDTLDDAVLQKFCDQANMWIETKTGRVLAPFVIASTTVTGSLAVGQTVFTVGNATGLSVFDSVLIGPVSGVHESATVQSLASNTITLATGLVSAYAASATVVECFIYDGFDALESGKMLPLPLGLSSITSLEVSSFSAGQGGATTNNTIWFTEPGTDYFFRPGPQDRTPGWPATELWITNVPVPSNTYPSFFPGYNNVRIVGTPGWAAIPDDIVECADNIAIALYRSRGTSGGDVLHVGSDGSQIINRALSYENKLAIQRYSRHDVRII